MRKGALKWSVCAVITALTLCVTACGGSEDAVTADTNEVKEIVETDSEVESEVKDEPEVQAEPEEEPDTELEDEAEPERKSEAEEEAEAEEKAETASEAESDSDSEQVEEETEEGEDEYTTLEDYYNDPEVRDALKSAFAVRAGDGMSADCVVKGNEFTVIIKIEDRSMIVDGMAEHLNEALDTQADRFKAQVKQFDDVIGQEGACTVIMRYTDPDDNILAEKAFTAN